MPKPNVFISHRWDANNHYYSLTQKFDQYEFHYLDYSVPQHDPADATRVRAIQAALKEQVRQCNYFIIFANRAISNSRWCMYELSCAKNFNKLILGVNPFGYTGGTPPEIMDADNQNGPVGFHAPAIIRKICTALTWPVPENL